MATSDASTGPTLSQDGLILRNLRGAMYKMSLQSLDARTVSMAALRDLLFIGLVNKGLQIYRIVNGSIAHERSVRDTGSDKAACSVYDVSVSEEHLVYIREEDDTCAICVQRTRDVLEGKEAAERTMPIGRRAPMVVDHELGLIAISGAAWSTSWTASGAGESTNQESSETHIRVVRLSDFETVREWRAADTAVALLRHQATPGGSMLGAADTRTGLSVYDLRQPTDTAYACVYQVPVDEIRNFRLVGDFVAVFHKFEPNVSFWNMREQKTILCINIQDQMKELAEEFLEDGEEEDAGLFEEEDDHVTSVTCVPSNDDHVLIYGTKSGCIFGMSVHNRSKLFNIPCPHELPDADSQQALPRRDVLGVQYLADGKLVVSYEKYGLTVLDFSPEDPPDRPPTRCQKRPE